MVSNHLFLKCTLAFTASYHIKETKATFVFCFAYILLVLSPAMCTRPPRGREQWLATQPKMNWRSQSNLCVEDCMFKLKAFPSWPVLSGEIRVASFQKVNPKSLVGQGIQALLLGWGPPADKLNPAGQFQWNSTDVLRPLRTCQWSENGRQDGWEWGGLVQRGIFTSLSHSCQVWAS